MGCGGGVYQEVNLAMSTGLGISVLVEVNLAMNEHLT